MAMQIQVAVFWFVTGYQHIGGYYTCQPKDGSTWSSQT